MTVHLITAIYGDHDELKELPDGHGFDRAICYTDSDTLASDTWDIVLRPEPHLTPRLAAKLPKFMPWLYSTADYYVWVDASFLITDAGFKQFCLDSLGTHDLAVWNHPDRAERPDAYQEARFSTNMHKYLNQPLINQIEHYQAEGFPEHSGLYACGTIVWRNNDACKTFGDAWLKENMRWTIQDQVSFPYVAWKLQANFTTFPAHEYENPYLQWIPHRSNL